MRVCIWRAFRDSCQQPSSYFPAVGCLAEDGLLDQCQSPLEFELACILIRAIELRPLDQRLENFWPRAHRIKKEVRSSNR